MARYGLTLQTAPAIEPVTVPEANHQLGITGDYHDPFVSSLITAARQTVEARTSRALINQTWDYTLDCFPTGLDPIYLPKAPLSSVTHVKYYDTSGVQQTLSTNTYKVLSAREPGEILLKYQQEWPYLYSEAGVIEIRFVAGYGAAASSVPAALKQAVLLLVTHWFNNREAVLIGSISKEIELSFEALCSQYLLADEFHEYAR